MFEGEGEGDEGEAEVGIESAAVDETPAAEEPAKEEPAAEVKQAEAPPKPTPFERLSRVLETRGMKELVGLDADVEVTQEWLSQQPLEVRQRFTAR